MRIVLDTNVLISALAFPGSKPDQILHCIRRGEAELFVSPFILSEDDNRILECALAAQAEFLITGDKEHLLPLGSYLGTRIITPAAFLDLLESR